MTTHVITEDDLQAYVDGALEARRSAEVEAYLSEHADAAERVEAYRRQRAQLREALAPVAAELIPADLNLANLIERRRKRFSSWTRRSWQSAAAAMVLLCVGGVGGWGLRSATEPARAGIASLAQEAADSYAVYAPDQQRPVEIKAAEREQLAAWASGRLERPISVPDLSTSGFRFLGGRLVATPHGPAILYMFDNRRGVRLIMLARNMAIDKNAPMAERTDGELSSISWSRGGLGFSLVGRLTPSSLRPIADGASRSIS